MQALAEQAQHGVAIGFANPSIYQRYGSTAYHDVTSTPFGAGHLLASVRTIGTPAVVALGTAGQAADLGLTSTVGYDTTTGVGTPTRAYFQSFRR